MPFSNILTLSICIAVIVGAVAIGASLPPAKKREEHEPETDVGLEPSPIDVFPCKVVERDRKAARAILAAKPVPADTTSEELCALGYVHGRADALRAIDAPVPLAQKVEEELRSVIHITGPSQEPVYRLMTGLLCRLIDRRVAERQQEDWIVRFGVGDSAAGPGGYRHEVSPLSALNARVRELEEADLRAALVDQRRLAHDALYLCAALEQRAWAVIEPRCSAPFAEHAPTGRTVRDCIGVGAVLEEACLYCALRMVGDRRIGLAGLDDEHGASESVDPPGVV